MDMNEKPKLSGVPETMLQTVYARAKETKTRGAIKDTKAVEIIDKINYDFSLADKDSAMHSGVVARTIVLDKLANKYLAKNKGAVVVNIACGLDTRCYRMNGYTHWYNLDLPETIAVREKLLPESGEISQIAMSAMDDWSGEITEHDAPAIVIIEGLTMYLSEKDVKEIFDVISKRFDHVTVLYMSGVEFTAKFNGVNADMDQQLQTTFCCKPDGMLCVKDKGNSSLCRRVDIRLLWHYNDAVSHHLLRKRFIRCCCDIRRLPGYRTVDDDF